MFPLAESYVRNTGFGTFDTVSTTVLDAPFITDIVAEPRLGMYISPLSGSNTPCFGSPPTVMVSTTALVAPSITETVPLPALTAYTWSLTGS